MQKTIPLATQATPREPCPLPPQVAMIAAFLYRLAPGYYHSQDIWTGLELLFPDHFRVEADRKTPADSVKSRLNENLGTLFQRSPGSYFALLGVVSDTQYEKGSARRQAEQLSHLDVDPLQPSRALVSLGGLEVTIGPDAVIEGEPKVIQHLVYERNRQIVEAFKTRRLKETGGLKCDGCDIDFHATLGDLGRSCVEAHHEVPLNNRGEASVTTHNDLKLLCCNCHALIHALGKVDCISVDELHRRLADAHEAAK